MARQAVVLALLFLAVAGAFSAQEPTSAPKAAPAMSEKSSPSSSPKASTPSSSSSSPPKPSEEMAPVASPAATPEASPPVDGEVESPPAAPPADVADGPDASGPAPFSFSDFAPAMEPAGDERSGASALKASAVFGAAVVAGYFF